MSRSLRRAALLALAALAGILPADAFAHGTISPTSAQRGATQSFVVAVPNISSAPRSGLFPLRVALTGTAAAEPSSGTRTLVVALIGGGVLALAILAALLLPRLRRP